jgi:hypothetical protein
MADRQDWTEINADEPIGPGTKSYGRLLGGAGLPTNIAALPWTLDNATFQIDINGLGLQNIVCDFTAAADIDDAAAIIQENLRIKFPAATCKILSDNAGIHLEITSGRVAGGSVSYALPGVGGTDVSAQLLLTAATGAVRSTPTMDAPKTIYGLQVPRIDNWYTLTQPEWFWTHYSIYRTGNLGAFLSLTAEQKKAMLTAVHIEGGVTVINSRDQFIWDKDLRVMAAFIARRRNGYVELRADAYGGEFEKADEGSIVEFEDGSRVQLSEGGYVNNKRCRYASAGDYYYGDDTDWMAACIGDGRCARIVQAGNIITIYPGSQIVSLGPFVNFDVRKPLLFSNGYRTYVRRRISNVSVEVYDDDDKIDAAVTLDPDRRAYTDIVDDDALYPRASGWTCKNRFFQHFKPCNLIATQPGFILVAKEGSTEGRYCQTGPGYKQFTGYHDRDLQKFDVKNAIVEMVSFRDKYSVLCKGSIWTGMTNSTSSYLIPGTEQEIRKIFDPQKRADFGISHKSAVKAVNDEMVRIITNTIEIRDFNGIDFGQDLITSDEGLKRMVYALRKAYKHFCMVYSKITGFVIWWKDK